MLDASVIIATYNRSATLKTALQTLARQRVPAGFTWEALIVDNNSNDDTRQVVASAAAQSGHFRYLFEERQGKTHALNAGIAEANGRILVFTDDDVSLAPTWLANLVAGLESSGCAAAGGAIVPVWNAPKPRWLNTDGPYRLGAVIVSFDLGAERCLIEERLPLGANLAIRAETLTRLGAFRTDLGPTTGSEIRGEDSEICQRILDAGERIIYLPDAVVYHPVDRRRVNRRYFERYYFAQGQAITRYEGIPADAPRHLRVPRYLIAAAAVRCARWLASFDSTRRFYHKLQFYYAVGRIVEARRQPATATGSPLCRVDGL